MEFLILKHIFGRLVAAKIIVQLRPRFYLDKAGENIWVAAEAALHVRKHYAHIIYAIKHHKFRVFRLLYEEYGGPDIKFLEKALEYQNLEVTKYLWDTAPDLWSAIDLNTITLRTLLLNPKLYNFLQNLMPLKINLTIINVISILRNYPIRSYASLLQLLRHLPSLVHYQPFQHSILESNNLRIVKLVWKLAGNPKIYPYDYSFRFCSVSIVRFLVEVGSTTKKSVAEYANKKNTLVTAYVIDCGFAVYLFDFARRIILGDCTKILLKKYRHICNHYYTQVAREPASTRKLKLIYKWGHLHYTCTRDYWEGFLKYAIKKENITAELQDFIKKLQEKIDTKIFK
jgi:hypothetical protein